jgi:(p)ppGpp synthase/HD superfamily hydrolase
MTTRILRAFQMAVLAHGDQKRKHTGEPYVAHLAEVALTLAHHGFGEDVVIAAILHDTLEDTNLRPDEISEAFGEKVTKLVLEVTDVYTPDAYPTLNRKVRKANEVERLSKISFEGKSIKLADLLSNTRSIREHDPEFAKVYLREKRELLKVMGGGHMELRYYAERSVE